MQLLASPPLLTFESCSYAGAPLSHDMTGNALRKSPCFIFHVSTSSGFHVGSLFAFFHMYYIVFLSTAYQPPGSPQVMCKDLAKWSYVFLACQIPGVGSGGIIVAWRQATNTMYELMQKVTVQSD